MTRKAIYIAAFCLASFSVARAQDEPPRFSVSVGGGFTKPVDNLENRIDTGWNVQGGAGINIVPWLGVMGQFMYTESGLTGSYLRSLNQPDGNFRMYGFSSTPSSGSIRAAMWTFI